MSASHLWSERDSAPWARPHPTRATNVQENAPRSSRVLAASLPPCVVSFPDGSRSESETRTEQLTSSSSDVLGVIKELQSEISQRDPEVLRLYPVEPYCKSLGRVPAHSSYTHIASEAIATSERLVQRGGVAIVGCYHKLVLATLVSAFEDRLPSQRIPASIESLMRLEYRPDRRAAGRSGRVVL